MFALDLNRRKLAKNPIDLIRCKFSIDARAARGTGISGLSTISKPYRSRLETMRSPSAWNALSRDTRKARQEAVFGRLFERLSVRLISL
jgi:hypothetical protein